MKEYITLFWEFFKVGLFTIGGGMAMLPLIQKIVVEDKKWMTQAEMIDCLAVSQALPGVIAINAATYIGKQKKGLRGSLAATIGVVMPSFVIIILAVTILGAVGTNRYVEGAFTGIKAAVCGLVCVSAYRLGQGVLKGPFQWAVMIFVFGLIVLFRITAVWAVLIAAAAGIVYTMIREKRREKS